MRSTAGRLLVASPLLVDPNFSRSIVVMLEHDQDGALGLVINRPTDVAVGQVLDSWASRAATPAVLFAGGPVSPESAIGLGRIRGDPPKATLVGDAGMFDLNTEPSRNPEVSPIRVFAGYSGWGPGQLDAELGVDGWIVVKARARDVFDESPATLWQRVLRRQRGSLAWLATFPTEVADN